ncbi:MAG TPA: 4-dihydromethyl-trisporate dehydrogenase [Planctomycetaceae bacterium]|nr:4-dihydromethyl-trisporate dehydrogenase [Planctomycetaceae bacterium]
MEYLKLNTGDQLPQLGYGFWKVDPQKIPSIVEQAVEAGYRHFDCACDYGNETEVGQGIASVLKEGQCQRDDLWLTSKLWNTFHAPEHVEEACKKTLHDLQVDQLDLYLIHFPISLKYVPIEKRYPPGWFFDPEAEHPKMETTPVPISETWQAMEELVDAGLVKNIGVSNFGTSLIRDLLSYARIRPAVLQIESHPYLTQEKLIRYCKEEEIAVTAFSPLGALSYLSLDMASQDDSVLTQPVVKAAAKQLGKTPAQIVLRWGVQRGTSIVPKTENPDRLIENISIFDFELTPGEMHAISSLNQNRRFNDPGDFAESAFNTFFPIYE